ncbi:SNF2 family DNA/RNA helicase [Corynebacterium kutscheri]|uniref:Helicase family protein n=1 Tax=Corynebacterium kutscheri TaxID=35755 RepID=A0A0F6TD11_9CORY|nr:SNF2-related protein [Corynebacterium kutscheri]AKE41329.1 helicase family protein [Corynebacterium kutscheri]VEH08605.1 SNF2 family DNA/RNA helicase [Corynebacterium kutscheri]VEH09651.1 SNF2 family DNA/RNA helicase [Corynebacterium kutscheri]VEH79734.1 SNF2 family DNA/RNA helicase [Corynebacterium kutscheri]
MDRTQFAQYQHQANLIKEMRQRAYNLFEKLSHEETTARLLGQIQAGDESGSIHLLDPALVYWPNNLYVRAEFADSPEVLNILQAFRRHTQQIESLVEESAGAYSGFFQRLSRSFSGGFDQKKAQNAAEQLVNLLNDYTTQNLYQQVAGIVNRALEVEGQQAQGVALSDNALGVPQKYIDAAHKALIQAVRGIDYSPFATASIDTVDRLHIIPAQNLVRRIVEHPASVEFLQGRAQGLLQELSQQRAMILLSGMDVEKLKEVTNERLRFSGLDSIGITTVAEVYLAHEALLRQVSGIGEQTAQRMKAAAQSLYAEAQQSVGKNIGEEKTIETVELLTVLDKFSQANQLDDLQRERRDRLIAYFQDFSSSITAIGEPFVVVKFGEKFYDQFIEDIAWANASPELFLPRTVVEFEGDIWQDYLDRPAHYQSLLAELLGAGSNKTGGENLDEDTLEQIRNLVLDQSLLNGLHLRGYQSFGTKFALVQRKVIIGDEMGLGKTVQAIAAAAHIHAQNKQPIHTAVVVPASLIMNWKRELEKFSTLHIFVGHGIDKEVAVQAWRARGGVIIVTYDGARTMDLGHCDMVIVDEAHMIKNPAAQRSQAVAALIKEAEYAILMSGTPMENQVYEFANLVKYLDSELGTLKKGVIRPTEFRARIAPLYLRRNQADVLDELPEKVEHIEWIELSSEDQKEYTKAIAEGSWMRARRATLYAPNPGCAKIERIREIIDEALEENRNVLIFSYFRDSILRLAQEFGSHVVGVISGEVSPIMRQKYVDALGESGKILIAQIGAGGVGLNIQKASVVILVETQVKPTIEDQAIARAHRLGQMSVVNVYRIIGDETIDERLYERNVEKRKLFDAYARQSDAAHVADAVDISEAQLAREIITEERIRLGLESDLELAPIVLTETTDHTSG